MNMEGSWLDWEWVDSDRIGGRRVEVRWDGFVHSCNLVHRGQIRYEDGRIEDFILRNDNTDYFLIGGYSFRGGEEWVESNGKRYNDIFDLINGDIRDEGVIRRSNVVRRRIGEIDR